MTATAGRAGAASLAALLVVAVVQQATTSDVVADLLSLVSPAVCSLVLLAAVRAGRFSRPWPWLCLAASAGCVALGNTVWLRHTLVGEAPFPGWGDVLYLSSYPPLLAAVVGLGRLGRRRLPAVLDAAVLAVAVALPLWFLVGAPALVSGDALSRLVGLAYPAADLLVLALLTVLLLGPTAARGGQRLLALSVLVDAMASGMDRYRCLTGPAATSEKSLNCSAVTHMPR